MLKKDYSDNIIFREIFIKIDRTKRIELLKNKIILLPFVLYFYIKILLYSLLKIEFLKFKLSLF